MHRIEIQVQDSAWSRQHGTVGQWRDSFEFGTREEAARAVEDLLAVGTVARIKQESDED